MNPSRNLWRETYQAYFAYIDLRTQLFASADFDEQIGKALHHTAGRKLALKTLKTVATAHISRHAAAVFKEAMSGNGNAPLARAVLERIGSEDVATTISPLIRNARDEANGDPVAVGRIVDLLKNLNQEAMAHELVLQPPSANFESQDRQEFVPKVHPVSDSMSEVVGLSNGAGNVTETWELELRAEQKFRSLRQQLVNDPHIGDYLREGLSSGHGRGLAFEIMFDIPVEYTKQNIATVFDDATSTNGYFDPARDLLARLEFDESTEILRPLLEERLETDDHPWEAYLRSAELLGELGQDKLLQYVVARARNSDDPDVVETAEYYDSGTFARLDRVALRGPAVSCDVLRWDAELVSPPAEKRVAHA